MGGWPTDQDLAGASHRMVVKLLEMYDLTWPFDPNQPVPNAHGPRARIDSFRRDHESFLFFDPQKITEEYDRMLNIAKRTGDNPYAVADFDETRRHLIPWTGEAATAFDRPLSLMTEYCELQQTNIAQALQGLLMMGQLAIQARHDYLELAEATIAAADKEISGQATRDVAAVITTVSKLVDKVIDFNPAAILSSGLSLLSATAADVIKQEIGGSGRDAILDRYCHWRDQQRGHYEEALQRAKDFLITRMNEAIEDGHPLKEPLPVCCDVDSPDFSYEKFYPRRDVTPAQSAPTVAEERKAYVDEKQAAERDSKIGRRLAPDKGAV